MWQPLLVLAFVASTFLITSSEGSSSRASTSSSSSSGSNSSGRGSYAAAYSGSSSSKSRPKKPKTCPSVPAKRCPKPNEVYDECPALCPPRECGVDPAVVLCLPSPSPGDPECQPGCRCRDDYLRNSSGICVYKDDCPKCTNPNEVYDECPALCPPRRCDVDDSVIRCAAPPELGDDACEPGCRCADGFVKNNEGICVTRDQCPPECGENMVYSECPAFAGRPLTCSQVGFPIETSNDNDCPFKPGCICEEGYVQNKKGYCIPINDCPSCGGDFNATSGCGVNCGRLCSNYKSKDVGCIEICYENACDCKEKYVFDENTKQCVLPEDCSPVCGKNEVYSSCTNGGCGPKECSGLGYKTGCVKMDLKYCTAGCICKDDYLRDENGECIPKSECPACGGDTNAVSGCGVNCNKRCSDIGKKPQFCIAICYDDACDCKDGFFLDDNTGKCVPQEECTPTCGENEVFSSCVNGGCDRKDCSQLGQPIRCVRPKKCYNGCLCKEGWLRAANGSCVPEDQCPQYCPKPHEIYDPCPPSCPPQTCESINKRYSCPLIPAKKSSKYCKGQCRCEDGYLRNKIGECISTDDCLKCTGPHEYYSCGGACDNVCATLSTQNQTNCPIVNIKCNEMCYCEEGYARDDDNICVPIEECPIPQCGKNERLENCPDTLCTPQSCSQIGFPLPAVPCPASEDGTCQGPPACVCIDDYVKDDDGNCIPKEECPSCGGDPNAVSGCGVNCGRLCSNYDKGPVPCIKICKVNACDCKDDYVLDENTNKCVLPQNCTPTCGVNEVYDSCGTSGCRRWKCSQPPLCIDTFNCEGACVCKDKYSRADNGSCIPEDECEQCNKPHEYYDSCAPTCPPQTCESIGRQYKCPPQPLFCRGACRCEKGYYRNINNDCVTEKQCKKCTGPNEYYACGGACDNVCAALNKQNQTNCPIINIKCNEMCYCKEGYARNDKNICIPIDQCPKPQCPDGERYEENPDSLCAPLNCSQIGFPVTCPALTGNTSKCPTPPGCVCENDNVRDDQGNCIPRNQCPSCGGDKNATGGCNNYCGNRCSDYNKTVFCPLFCDTNGCGCKPGLVYDDNLKKCVDPNDCTPTCGINEVYSSCGNGGCRRWNCADGNAILCIDPIECEGRCICQDGYSRARNGTCIPEDQCPPECPYGERYEECPDNLCSAQTCSQLGFPLDCPGLSGNSSTECPGEPGCVCDNNNVRDDDGNCIPVDQCPSCGGDENAVSGCGINCGRRCSDYKKKNVACILLCKLNACDCRKGFVYDDKKKKCVRPENCTPTCGINEIYSDCINGGCQAKNCSQLGKDIPCEQFDTNCIQGCLCKENYLRADDGTCVPQDECQQPQCGINQTLVKCPIVLCQPLSCSEVGYPIACPGLAEDGTCPGPSECVCDDNKVKDDNGNCIPAEQCPSCGGDPNAVQGCGTNCGRRCTDYRTGATCLGCSFNACDCREGYVLDEYLGKCVLPEECQIPLCPNPHEVYDPCPSLCPPQTCESIGRGYNCPALIEKTPETCQGACICEKGYYRNKIGDCILAKECLKCTGPNEYFSCGVACDNVCATLKKQNQTYCPIINKKCNPMCYCDEGYARNKNNTCIPIQQCEARSITNPIPSVNKTEAKARLDKASIALSGQIVSQLSKTKPGENFVASPTSLLIPLAQAALFATGLVLEQLLKLLGLLNGEEIKAVFKDEVDNYKHQQNVTFESASRYYFGDLYKLNETFQSVSEDIFEAKGEIVNFGNNIQAAKIINDWVSDRTRGKILDLISADSLSANTVLVLVNAIYFLGNWVNQFNEDYTQKRNFTKLDGQVVEVDTMYQESTFKYVERSDLKLQAIEMPYKGYNFSFCIILPDLGSYPEVVQSLEDADVFLDILDSMSSKKVKTYVPKMKINTKIDLAELLKSIGVTAMFDRTSDGFRGMVADNIPVYISEIVQKAFIEVTEKGTEATAATGIIFGVTSLRFPPAVPVFRADRPFLFYILSSDRVPRFCGRFAGTD